VILGAVTPRAVIYRLRPTTSLDSLGDPVESWEAPERTRLRRAECQTAAEAETGLLLEHERRLFVAGVADLTAADRIEAEGETWLVDGTPVVRRALAAGTVTVAKLTRLSGRKES
jgi:head-tail adaptor